MLVTISGRVGRDAEFKDVPLKDGSGSFEVAESSLAVTPSKDGTDWYGLKFQGDSLLKTAEYVQKGQVLSVTGELTIETWKDADNNNRSKPVVIVKQVQLPAKSVG
jgi:single-strand DNA-binding protein